MGNGTLVPIWARRWSGAPAHHRWDARTRCPQAPDGSHGYAFVVILPTRGRRRWASGLTAALATVLVVASCSTGTVASFDPTGPCTADGAAPGAYPDLEARIPTLYEGLGPTRLDSGRHCSPENLGSLVAAGLTEVRYAGGTWDFGGDAAAALVVFQADGLTADLLADFYAQSARAADRTTITAESTPTLAGRPGHRIDTTTGSRSQTIVLWPSADADVVDVVIANELPDPKIQSAVDAFGGR
jgi:hypothetical protein